MARLTYRLTAVGVTNETGEGFHPDGDGLYLRVTKTGTKSWMFRFKRDGVTRDMGLGPVAEVSLAKARELAGSARRQLLDGIDPIKARKAQQATAKLAEARGITFKTCAEQFIAAHEVAWRNPKHRQQWRSTLKSYVYPAFGDLSVAAIDTGLIMRVLEPIWPKKPETASRTRARIEMVLDWARARGYREGENAARWRGHLDHLLPPRTKVRRIRHHPALPYAEVPAFMKNLRSRTNVTARALEFTILTAARTGETLGARWDEFILGQRVWTIPAERMKGNKAHRVPLTKRAIEILTEMPQTRLNEFVFPGMKQGRSLTNMALLMLLRDIHPGITTHGFRSTFKDWAVECTTTPNFVSEAALAHAVADKTEAAYRRADLFEKRRKLMEAWSAFCDRGPSSVIPLRRQLIVGAR